MALFPTSPAYAATPVLIDAVNKAGASYQDYTRNDTTQNTNFSFGMGQWVFHYTGTTFYAFLQNTAGGLNQAAGAFKSTDGGLTWARMDAAHQPANGNVLACFQSGSVISVAYGSNGIGNIFINTFDMSTDLWGTASVALPAFTFSNTGNGTMLLTGKSNGDLYLFFNTNIVAIGVGSKGPLYYVKYSSGTWGAPTVIGTDAAGNYYSLQGVVTDSSDLTHVVFALKTTAPAQQAFWYVQVDVAGNIGSPTLFYNMSSFSFPGINFCGNLVIQGSNLILAIENNSVTFNTVATQLFVFVGTGLVSPVWTLENGIDPTNISNPQPNGGVASPRGVILNGQYWYFWVVGNVNNTQTPQQMWANMRTAGGVWQTPALVYDYNANPPIPGGVGDGFNTDYVDPLSIAPYTAGGGGFLIQFNIPNAGVGPLATLAGFAINVALPAPAAVGPTPGLGGGGTLFPRVVNKTLLYASLDRNYAPISSFFLFANDFDLCLVNEFERYNDIDYNGVSCARLPTCFLEAKGGAFLDPPKGFVAFNPIGFVALPAPGDGEVVALSFRVPYGYDGLILAQFHQYTQNYTQGSGDLIWRVRADRRYLRNTGNMQVSIGNSKQLSPVYGGLRIYSGNLVEYTISAPNTSGLLPPPGTGNILVGLHGYFYPRK